MTVIKGFVIIIASGLCFSLGGWLIGYSLAVAAPGYYRAVFSTGREPWFDPVAVGVGLGITQGLVCGLAVGAVVVLAVAWYNARRPAVGVDLPRHRSLSLTEAGERGAEEHGITGRPGK